MSPNGKKLIKSIFTVNLGCCRDSQKLSGVFEPKPKAKTSIPYKCDLCHTSSSSWERDHVYSIDDEDSTSATFSINIDASSQYCSESENDPNNSITGRPSQKICESIAVVKDSDEPYLDFRHSMIQMILEKEIFSKEDLQDLLCYFLELNSPCHHQIIIQAFTEIWNVIILGKPILEKPRNGDVSRES